MGEIQSLGKGRIRQKCSMLDAFGNLVLIKIDGFYDWAIKNFIDTSFRSWMVASYSGGRLYRGGPLSPDLTILWK
jgi:hypothetical protein